MVAKINDRVTTLEVKFDEFYKQNSNEHKEIMSKIDSINTKIDTFLIKRLDDRYAKKETETKIETFEFDLDSLKKDIKWAYRTSIGTFLSFLIAIVVVIIKIIL